MFKQIKIVMAYCGLTALWILLGRERLLDIFLYAVESGQIELSPEQYSEIQRLLAKKL